AYLLLENFRSTWMQTEGTQFYRPVISLTLALDYLFWGPRAFGFHLSNLFYQCLCSIGLYLLSKRLFITDLTSPLGEGKKEQESQPVEQDTDIAFQKLSCDHIYSLNIQALLTACIFAAHPLHPEVVSWIIGRVDSVCAASYLFSFWFFLISIQTSTSRVALTSRAISLFLFAFSLGSKEMAVTLPPSMVLLLLLFPAKDNSALRSLIVSIARAFKLTWHYWLLLGFYFMIRTFALGSFSGGYQGSIAEGFSNSLITRLLSEQSLYRIMFPLNAEVFAGNQLWLNCLRIILGLSLFSFVINLLISRSKPTILKAVCFSGAWFAIVMLPTIPVWNLTGTLQSSRFIYLGTAPLAILLSLAICPLSRRGRRSTTSQGKTELTLRISQDFLKGLTAVLSVSLIALLTSITLKNNAPWVHAGKELTALQKDLAGTLNSMPEKKKLALLNLPDRYMGSHMLYNGSMLKVLMEPPLTETNLSDRIVTFEPALYGDSDLIVTSRLRAIVAAPDRFDLYRWRRDILKLEKLSLQSSTQEPGSSSGFSGSMNMSPASLLVSPPLNLKVLDCDLIEAIFSISKKGKAKNQNEKARAESILVRFNTP
ncbi:MAG: hypothetical protein K8F91_15850, partial [Candidatus Obscuribacterales bacterium]|nr:hypothetical protein [Candidatus Obscuribacterales bacterium]